MTRAFRAILSLAALSLTCSPASGGCLIGCHDDCSCAYPVVAASGCCGPAGLAAVYGMHHVGGYTGYEGLPRMDGGGLHARYPYHSYRRPWAHPGPASANVTIIW